MYEIIRAWIILGVVFTLILSTMVKDDAKGMKLAFNLVMTIILWPLLLVIFPIFLYGVYTNHTNMREEYLTKRFRDYLDKRDKKKGTA